MLDVALTEMLNFLTGTAKSLKIQPRRALLRTFRALSIIILAHLKKSVPKAVQKESVAVP